MKKMIFVLAAVLLLSGCAGSGDDSKIIFDPDSKLRNVSAEVDKITEKELNVIEDMMNEVENFKAAGLAAPQIGVNQRIIVINDFDQNKLFAMVNPQIISSKDQTIAVESCLSIKGLSGIVKRSNKIEVSFMDEKGNMKNSTYTGLTARTIQHEIDHLNGILFYDKAEHVFSITE